MQLVFHELHPIVLAMALEAAWLSLGAGTASAIRTHHREKKGYRAIGLRCWCIGGEDRDPGGAQLSTASVVSSAVIFGSGRGVDFPRWKVISLL